MWADQPTGCRGSVQLVVGKMIANHAALIQPFSSSVVRRRRMLNYGIVLTGNDFSKDHWRDF
jgi:hypothetical protein